MDHNQLNTCRALAVPDIYILYYKFAAVIGSKSKYREIVDYILVLVLHYSVPIFLGFPYILGLESYWLSHSSIVIDDDKDILKAYSERRIEALKEIEVEHFY